MNMVSTLCRFLFVLSVCGLIAGCSSQPASSLQSDGKLTACPTQPHCVGSYETDAKHQIAALQIQGDAALAWAALKAHVTQLPRTEVVADKGDYMHVVFTTRLMRFKDDAEFRLQTDRSEIAVRSSSRVGYSDMNVNRKRLEAIRTALRAQGVVK
ncbi:MAG: DUF1499 domain-containing protein [Candidatus Obscuribacterales bacterium]|nr:DUF1499 domain-containing protein [Steroidobacteraceae bacterium]